MIEIDNVLISDDVVQQQFICDLNKCKGGCCEEGDAGAPLENDELQQVHDSFEIVKPMLTAEAIAEIENKGRYVYNQEFGWVTPTLGDDNGICVYALRDANNIIKCSFEQAYNEGLIGWKKPISCHLYPIITKKGKHGNYQRMNYDPRQQLCAPACSLGKKLKVPVYKFLKEPLIRKFGEGFYEALDQVAIQYFDEDKK
jgi:hypothetical protein